MWPISINLGPNNYFCTNACFLHAFIPTTLTVILPLDLQIEYWPNKLVFSGANYLFIFSKRFLNLKDVWSKNVYDQCFHFS